MSRRSTRASEDRHPSREEETRAEVWEPAAVLEAPPPREGFRQRWISTQIHGQEVPHHVIRRFREGWAPRPADTVPDDFPVPTIQHGTHEGSIGVEGMLLCELPEAKAVARAKYFGKKTGDLNRFVEQSLSKTEKDGGEPIEREFNSTVTRGRPAPVADDD